MGDHSTRSNAFSKVNFKFLALAIIAFSLAALSFSQDAHAATFTAVQDGDWNDPSTWGGTTPDESGDKAILAGITVTISSGTLISNDGTIDNSGTITIADIKSSISNSGTINNSGTITNSGGIFNFGTINNQCGATYSGNLPTGNPINDIPCPDSDGDGVPDSTDVCPGFDDNLDADGDGAPDGCDSNPNAFTAENSGSWNDPNVWEGGIVPGAADDKEILAGITVTISSGTLISNDGTIDNSGTITIADIKSSISNSGTINNSGTITNSGGIFNFGTINNQCGATYSGNLPLGNPINNILCDTTPPVITISGDNPATHEAATPYVDAGATALDDFDGDLTSEILVSNNIDENTPGQYTVEYSVTDSSGNAASAQRTVNVVDTTPPVITVLGDNPVTILEGLAYTDAGATASDVVDGDLTGSITVDNPVDTSVPDTYTVTYTVSDSAGNTAVAERTVVVKSVAEAVGGLEDQVNSLGLPKETANSLASNLDTAISNLSDGNPNNDSAACGMLGSFVNKVEAQSGKKIDSDDAVSLIADAELIRTALGC